MSNFKKGDKGIVIKYKSNNDLYYKRRLLLLGFIPGVKFKVRRVAPLGDPVELCLDNVTISVRRLELDMAVVKKIDYFYV